MATEGILAKWTSFAPTSPSETHPLTVAQFIAKGRKAELNEQAAAQAHLLDLCRPLGHPTPAEANAPGAGFCAVFHAHGWGPGMEGEQLRDELLKLNLTRASPPAFVPRHIDATP